MIQTYQTTLTEKKELVPEVWYFKFVIPETQELQYTAGQYMILFVPQPEGHSVRRLYSVLSAPQGQKFFELVIKLVPGGIASEYLKTLTVGSRATFQGPAGVFTLNPGVGPKVFFATGTGITPMLSIIEKYLPEVPAEEHFYLYWGMRTKTEMYFQDKLIELAKKYPNFHLKYCLSRETGLESMSEIERPYCALGRVTAGFEADFKNQAELTKAHYYICGGRDAVETLRQILTEKQIPKELVHFEKF